MGGARYADAGGGDERTALFQKGFQIRVDRNEKFTLTVAKIRAVQLAVDAHGGAQFSRAVRQGNGFGDGPVFLHQFDSDLRFNGANENRFSMAYGAANRIYAKMRAVNKIDIGASGRSIHYAGARGFAGKPMGCRVIRKVSLNLHNWAAAKTLRSPANQPLSQKARSHRFRRWFIIRLRQGNEVHHIQGWTDNCYFRVECHA